MKKLRKKIVWYFIICSFLLQCVLSAIDSTVGTMVESHVTEEAVEGIFCRKFFCSFYIIHWSSGFLFYCGGIYIL